MIATNYRTEIQDKLKLSTLFLEPKYIVGEAIYTLKERDKEFQGKIYPSLYRLYVEMADVTEYNFANKYLESYQHWDALCQEEFFKPYIARWRKELELKVKSTALLEIIAQSVSDDPRKRLEAAKYLYEKVYAGSEKGAGRPSKRDIKAQAEKVAKEQKIITEHWERLN